MDNARRTALDPLQQPELLDTPVSDLHLAQIASNIRNWEEVAPFLGLTDAEEEEIRQDNKEYGVQKRKALQRWREKKGSNATYQELRDALKRAEEACTNSEWKQFRGHLIAWGKQTPHPSYEQRPTLEMSIYVDLSLVTLDGGSDVRLSSVLGGKKRQVVLIEGPPGSGKTTLTWHISQQWAEGKLFQQFSLLIPISLSTTGAETTSLADIIPYPSKKVREKVADAIAEKEGKGVCFVIDSWDEVPHSAEWQRSYLYNFVKGRAGYSLPHCSIIVTSRPAASSMLRTCATMKLQIAEFDALKIEEFVDRSMDTDDASRFLEILEEKPELYALCHLPLNITIAVYLYKTSNQELPSTRTKLYKALVDTQLARHWQLRTPAGDLSMGVDISNVMELLPEEILTKFKALCKLAYTGLKCGCSTFLPMAIAAAGLNPIAPNTISLMQSVKGVSTTTKHSFLHYTIQEYLAAYHISKLDPEPQREIVEELLQISPLTNTLPFYAGLTNLSNEKAIKALLKVVREKPLNFLSVHEYLVKHVNDVGSDPRRLLIALMNSIYESEVYELYKQIQPQQHQMELEISFDMLHLTPCDCLSIGCFLRHTEIDGVLPFFPRCNIKDVGFRMLVHQLIIKEQLQYNPRIRIYLAGNPLTHNAFKCLREGLGNRRIHLNLTDCLSSKVHQKTHVNIHIVKSLKYLIEGFVRSSGCMQLAIGANEITPEHKFHLLLLMKFSKSLESLELSGNYLRGTMPLLAPALNNCNLKELFLLRCYLDDNDVIYLGRALQSNCTLYKLCIFDNYVSPHTFSEFLLAVQYSALTILYYNGPISVAHMVMLIAINDNRYRCTAHSGEPLQLKKEFWNTAMSEACHWMRNMSSLPSEFATGQKE